MNLGHKKNDLDGIGKELIGEVIREPLGSGKGALVAQSELRGIKRNEIVIK